MLLNTGEYKESFDHVVEIISAARSNAVRKASAEMIHMYWLIGNELVERSEWGNKYVETLSRDIRAAFPGIKGFGTADNYWTEPGHVSINQDMFR